MKNLNEYWSRNISGKKIVVTGGTTGIGREIAILLTALGGHCMICGRNQPQVDETIMAANSQDSTGLCEGIIADLTNADDIVNLFEVVDQQLGGIDVLINNAALGYGSVTEGSYQDWDYIIRTNLTAYLACAHQAIKRQNPGNGHIINVGSMSADVREEGSSVYVATKSAIQGFSESLRREVNNMGIKVTLIEPGAVDTDMQPDSGDDKNEQVENREMLRTEDIAIAVAFCLAQHERCDVVNLQIRPHLQII